MRKLTAPSVVFAALALGATAQTTAPTDASPTTASGDRTHVMEQYVVTGSNIPKATDEPSLPISIVDRTRIESVGVQTTSDLLQMLPQVVGSANYRGEQVSNPGGGEAVVALRGLPETATLVLVNGRRVALTSAISISNSAVNINTIPLAAVERVEVLREGAGPIYGSDAIAGVVNIILRDHYEGSLLTVEYGNTTEKDAGTVIASILSGASNPKTDIVVSGSYFKRNAIFSRDRDIMRTADLRRFGADRGGADYRSSAAPRGRIFVNTDVDPDEAGLVYNGPAAGTGTTPAAYKSFGSADKYDFREITNEVIPQTRYGFSLSAKHRISDSVRIIGEAGYTHVTSQAVAAPTPLFSDQEPFQDLSGAIVQITIPVNNRYNPFGAGSSDGLYAVDAVYKRFLELGPRITDTDVNNIRTLAGLEGTVGDWRWSATGLFSRDETSSYNTNLINKRELFSQLQNSDPNIPSVNVFGDWTYNLRDAAQRAALDRIRLNAMDTSSYQLTQVDAKVNGNPFQLPAGQLGMAAGVEHRQERLDSNPDSAVTTFNTIGSTNQVATHGTRNVTSVYAEFSIPILANLPAVHSLEATASGRYERYNDFGNTTKPGASIRWKPIDESFALRVSYSEGFRAATLQELYLGGQESFEYITNPNAPSQNQTRNLQSGNPNLEPEKSRSWNIGAVYSPTQIKGLTLRVDYYSIFKKNNIGLLQTQYVVDQYLAGNQAFQGAVDVNPTSRFITEVRTPYSNLGKEVSRGFDYGFAYVYPTRDFGKFTFTFDATYLQTYLYTPDKSLPYIAGAGLYSTVLGNSLPRHRSSFQTQWAYQDFDATLTWNCIAALKEFLDATETYHRIETYNTIDLQVAYKLPRDMRLIVGVVNAADEKVPFIAGATSNAYDAANYSILGRNYYVRLQKKF